MYSAEQLQDARRRQIEIFLGMTGRAVEGVERLIDLNLRTARSAIAEASQTAIAAIGARDVQSVIGVRMASLQPAAEKFSAYSRDVSDIVSATGADLVQIAGTAAAEVRQQFFGAAEKAADQAAALASASGRNAAAAVAAGSEVASEAAEATLADSRQAVDDATTVLQNAAAEAQAAAAEAQAAAAAAEPSIIVSSEAAPKPTSRSRRNAA